MNYSNNHEILLRTNASTHTHTQIHNQNLCVRIQTYWRRERAREWKRVIEKKLARFLLSSWILTSSDFCAVWRNRRISVSAANKTKKREMRTKKKKIKREREEKGEEESERDWTSRWLKPKVFVFFYCLARAQEIYNIDPPHFISRLYILYKFIMLLH